MENVIRVKDLELILNANVPIDLTVYDRTIRECPDPTETTFGEVCSIYPNRKVLDLSTNYCSRGGYCMFLDDERG